MSSTSRSQKIRSILEARRPMADKVHKVDEILDRIESQIRGFKKFIPQYASRLEPEAASAISALLPDTDQLLAGIAHEKGRLALLAGRYSRTTLNIGVTGRAGQGKSTLIQQITGLTDEEIPSGSKGHCTGAPSIVSNHDSSETFADITFHTESGFLESVITPFFSRLQIGISPSSLDEFASTNLPLAPGEDSKDPTTDAEHLHKLHFFKDNLGSYRSLLTGQIRRIKREEIRSYIAQEDASGQNKLTHWIAVQMVDIKCRFPQHDVGSIALADTPGLGDFLSGAEERLVATVGKSLDVVVFLRQPPLTRSIDPADTNLHGLIRRSIPDLAISDWSYFVINNHPSSGSNLPYFKDALEKSTIKTRGILTANCKNETEVSACLDEILNDVALNLARLDQQLFEKQLQLLKNLTLAITTFVEKAEKVLPKATLVQPDLALLNRLFGEAWMNLGSELKKLVDQYRNLRNEPDQDFLAALKSVFANLDCGPNLPDPSVIEKEAAAAGLMKWQANKLHELRVNIANSFESIDASLHASFDMLRKDVSDVLRSPQSGRLANLDVSNDENSWGRLMELWEGHDGGHVMQHAINLLINAGLSFRGFIQPRVRHCLDVLDSDSPEAIPFCYVPGDTAQNVKDKLELAWQKACFNCRSEIEEMSKEPAMARFAAIEDFRDSILHTGGAEQSKAMWHLFYHENRAEIWPEQFAQLEGNTRLRREWENAVAVLKSAVGEISIGI